MRTAMPFLLLLVFGLLALAVNACWGSKESLAYVNAFVLVLTLVVLLRYALDTFRLAEATEKHFRYESTPVLSTNVDPQLVGEIKDPLTLFHISNDSRYHLLVKVCLVLQFVGRATLHDDRHYSGQVVWNIGPKQSCMGNFKILSCLAAIIEDLNSADFRPIIEKLKQPDQLLKVFIFSKYKTYELKDSRFTQNMPRTYHLKYQESRGNQLPLVWVYEFEAPPAEITQFAWMNDAND